MNQADSLPGDARPAIHLIDRESEALAGLALGIADSQPVLSALLLGEIERAEVHAVNDLPAQTVAMNTLVNFIDEGSGVRRSVHLVYPAEADIAKGRISILTPIGAGLIGLAEGDSIRWPDRDGRERALRVMLVVREGELQMSPRH